MVVISLFVITAIVDHCPNPDLSEVEKCQHSNSVKLLILARFFFFLARFLIKEKLPLIVYLVTKMFKLIFHLFTIFQNNEFILHHPTKVTEVLVCFFLVSS